MRMSSCLYDLFRWVLAWLIRTHQRSHQDRHVGRGEFGDPRADLHLKCPSFPRSANSKSLIVLVAYLPKHTPPPRTKMTLPRHLRLAVIIFPNAFPTDFIGPLDILNTLRPDQSAANAHGVSIKTTILAETAEPVVLTGGMRVVPDMTFEQALSVRNGHGEGEPGEGDGPDRGWDAVLVPGGGGARPHLESNRAARDFLREIVPSLNVLLTGESLWTRYGGLTMVVCTGSWLLASTGMLDGQRATTNKAAYKACLVSRQDFQPSLVLGGQVTNGSFLPPSAL